MLKFFSGILCSFFRLISFFFFQLPLFFSFRDLHSFRQKSIEVILLKNFSSLPDVLSSYHHHYVVQLAHISLTLSLFTSPYHSWPLAGLQVYTPYHHIAAACMFELAVLLLIGHMRGSTGVHHLRSLLASPAVSGISGSSSLYSFRDRL